MAGHYKSLRCKRCSRCLRCRARACVGAWADKVVQSRRLRLAEMAFKPPFPENKPVKGAFVDVELNSYFCDTRAHSYSHCWLHLGISSREQRHQRAGWTTRDGPIVPSLCNLYRLFARKTFHRSLGQKALLAADTLINSLSRLIWGYYITFNLITSFLVAHYVFMSRGSKITALLYIERERDARQLAGDSKDIGGNKTTADLEKLSSRELWYKRRK